MGAGRSRGLSKVTNSKFTVTYNTIQLPSFTRTTQIWLQLSTRPFPSFYYWNTHWGNRPQLCNSIDSIYKDFCSTFILCYPSHLTTMTVLLPSLHCNRSLIVREPCGLEVVKTVGWFKNGSCCCNPLMCVKMSPWPGAVFSVSITYR